MYFNKNKNDREMQIKQAIYNAYMQITVEKKRATELTKKREKAVKEWTRR